MGETMYFREKYCVYSPELISKGLPYKVFPKAAFSENREA
jgi:hypothetical protein